MINKLLILLTMLGILLFSTGITIKAETTIDEIANLPIEERIDKIGRLCQEDYQNTGILASVSTAQCILESGYLLTELSLEANNCFGMKANLSGNTWSGSTWDGNIYTKLTSEEINKAYVTMNADFRKYAYMEQSVADHSAYLLGAKKGDGLRYQNLNEQDDYKKAVQILVEGGYATDSKYADKICNIIEHYNLTKYDKKAGNTDSILTYYDDFYRVRKVWEDASSQTGAYTNLDNAKRVCEEGYQVFDPDGTVIYTGK